MASKAKSIGVVRAEQLAAGTQKHLANKGQLEFASATFTPAEITSRLQTLVSLRNEVNAAKAATKAKIAAEKAQAPALHSFIAAYEAFVKATFSNSPDVLADFGISKKARTPIKVEAKTAAVAKRKATRAARNTMGAKQRQAIKGDVTGVVVTPVAAPKPTVTVSSETSTRAPSTGTPTATTQHTA